MLHEGGVTWRYAGDARILPFLGRAFLLQVAHPTIAAGVAEHSRFKEDPFGRFKQSYGLVLQTLYAADGERVGAEVRASHRRITGVTAGGRRYHAFEPEAYFWVLATGYETVVVTAQRFLKPMSSSEERQAYDETRELGRRFGLRERDMPATLESFAEWYVWMLEDRIESNPTVTEVLATVRRPNPPIPIPRLSWFLPGRSLGAWRGLRRWEPSAPHSGSGSHHVERCRRVAVASDRASLQDAPGPPGWLVLTPTRQRGSSQRKECPGSDRRWQRPDVGLDLQLNIPAKLLQLRRLNRRVGHQQAEEGELLRCQLEREMLRQLLQRWRRGAGRRRA